jgi:predicted PurR-regulated permease PerM
MDRSVYRGLLLFAGTVLALWAFALILLPFIVPIAWALCLFALTARPYRWLAARWRSPRLTAGLFVVTSGVLVLAPLIYIATMFVEQVRQVEWRPAIERLKAKTPEALKRLDSVLAHLEAAGTGEQKATNAGTVEGLTQRVQEHLPAVASKIFGGSLVAGGLGFLMTPLFFLFGLLICLVSQYFLYREAPRLRSIMVDVSPLGEDDTDKVLDTLRGATVSAVVGGLLVAVAQGALGTIMFMIAGIHSPVMWGVVMAALSLLPFGGTAIIWGPAGVILLMTGEPLSGWFVLIFGAVIVGGADNVLRPLVLNRMGGKEVDIHPMLLFFAIVSGIGIFGVSGIVFGPLLIALLTTMVRIYREHGMARPDDPAVSSDEALTPTPAS